MAVVYNQLIPANNGLVGYNEAKELAIASVNQFGAVRFVGVGIAGGSCCAAAAVVPTAEFLAIGANAFSAAYSNSQFGQRGLDDIPFGGHAESALLGIIAGANLAFWQPVANNAVLFVELTPCGPCQNNLNLNFADPNFTLNVWWRWPYPGGGGVAAMNTFHGLSVANQILDIQNNW